MYDGDARADDVDTGVGMDVAAVAWVWGEAVGEGLARCGTREGMLGESV